MKKILNVLTVLLCAVLLISCSQDDGSGTGGGDEVNPFSAGWWKQTTTSGTTSVSQYFLFDEDKVLLRCGSDSYEFTGTQFDNPRRKPQSNPTLSRPIPCPKLHRHGHAIL